LKAKNREITAFCSDIDLLMQTGNFLMLNEEAHKMQICTVTDQEMERFLECTRDKKHQN